MARVKEPHFLLLGDRQTVVEALRPVVGNLSADAIEAAYAASAIAMFKFGKAQYDFARRLAPSRWRQQVSRAYYGAYNCSRAVKLAIDGLYSQDPKEHKKSGDLHLQFPKRNMYTNRLRLLREDRNTADYDHVATVSDLLIPRDDALILVGDFISDARQFLRQHGVVI